MNQDQLRNAYKILDCVEFIQKYPELVKKSERQILDPRAIARLILRRILKERYDRFSIRKNQTNYALRCEDETLYKVLYIARYICSSDDLQTRSSLEICEKLNGFAPIRQDLLNMQSCGINFSFKSDNRFFIYVDFRPMNEYSLDLVHADLSILTRMYRDYSFLKKVETMDRLSDLISEEIEIDEDLENLILLMRTNGVYNIPRGSITIDSDFLRYYAQREDRYRIRQVVADYQALRSQGEDHLQNEHSESVSEDNIDASASIPVRGFRLIRDEQVDNRPQAEHIVVSPATPTVDEIPLADNNAQQAFSNILRRISSDREDEEDEAEGLALTLNPISDTIRVTRQIETEERSFDLQDIMNYMSSIEITKQDSERFKISTEDIYDDIDEEKDGIYFTDNNEEIEYSIFSDNEELFKTKNYDSALEYFKKMFHNKEVDLKYYTK